MRPTYVCSGCGGERNRAGQRYCTSCHAAYMRGWRPDHPLQGEALARANTRSYANTYQRRGLLVPAPCMMCGSLEIEKHHPDYAKPLQVWWLCRPCHLHWHSLTGL